MSRITERSRSGALEAFLKGQKVLMLTEFDDDSLSIQRLEELLPEDARYLVDAVPAVENPEFKQAIEEMVEQKTEELTEESIAPPDEPEETEMKTKRKSTPLPESEHEDRRTIIGELVEQGYQNKEIAEKTGIPVGTVGTYAAMFRKQKKEAEKGKTGKNADRHLCMSCKYRSARTEVNGCDYAGIMEHSRGCTVEECTVYEKGARLKMKEWNE